ncbi:MAG: YfhO family protein [Bacteroidetes bacterium]|nr:YfhO family protein [Bacteroidota bacterium]
MKKTIIKNNILSKLIPHIVAVLIFLVLSAIYFSPQLKGDILYQHDNLQAMGMSKEVRDFRAQTGEEALWTNSAFGGMPAYQISVKDSNLINSFKNFLNKVIPRPLGYLFFLMLGFYILLLCFDVNPWVSIIGAIAFGFASLNILYLGAGHNAKINAISFIPPIIGGIYFTYRKNLYLGAALTALFLGLHIAANHFQITYYLLFLILAVIVVEFYYSYRKKGLSRFVKASIILLLVGLFGVLTNFSKLYLTYNYSKHTTRGESELTISADQNKRSEAENDALDRDYIKQYSLSHGEVWSLVIPDVKGGKMNLIGNKKDILDNVDPQYRNMVAQQASYWGEQMSSGGAFYFGASVFLLFLLGMFFVKDKIKWALFAVSLLAVFLSWKHSSLVDWFIDNFPLYNKFRDTKMMLILAQLSFPLLGMLFVNRLLSNPIDKKRFLYVSGGLLGLLILFYIMPTVWFSFFSTGEVTQFNKLMANYKGNPNAISQIRDLKAEIVNARVDIFKQDVLRSLFFIAATASVVYLFMIKKLKRNSFIVILALIVLVDLWFVDRRYLNDDNFQSKRQAKEPFQMTQADKYILQDQDPNFRVYNLTLNTFSDASTSYFHKSIGGYHGAKLKRYQELIEFQISKNNMDVLNMLNTKYFIVPDQNKQPIAQYNPEALGNAWFVEEYRIVPNANEEITALSSFNPAREAIVDERFEKYIEGKSFSEDTLSFIKLDAYKPNHLVYSAKCNEEKLAVFSEIYYPDGWQAYIDGKPTNHFRVNYVLRAMVIPEGEHTIEFKFEPKEYYTSNKISLVSSIVLLLFVLFVLGREVFLFYRKSAE